MDLLDGILLSISDRVEINQSLHAAVRQARREKMSLCLLCGGETTVNVRGKGKGETGVSDW